MNHLSQVREQTVELPDTAPRVRITAGFGSAGQKTWNLRRPVTLLGARRPAHIVLHDTDISIAHCVVVNTGTEILLKDLHTSGGTFCNSSRVDLVVLKDGDVLTIGKTNIQVAIRTPDNPSDDSGCGVNYVDPTRFSKPVTLQLLYTDMRWTIEEAVVLIGLHGDATVRLDHPDVSKRHAVLFRFRNEPAIFDLGSRTGVSVNDQRCSLTPLASGDCLSLGPFGLTVGPTGDEGEPAVIPAPNTETTSSVSPPSANTEQGTTATSAQAPADRDEESDKESEAVSTHVTPTDASCEDPLEDDIHSSWETLNSWQPAGGADATAADQRQSDLAKRAAELDARDAALRGQLHDVTRFHEQVLAREREIAALAAKTQADADALAETQKVFGDKEQELEDRRQELSRREGIVSQRWSRLTATKCSHCGKPVNIGKVDSG